MSPVQEIVSIIIMKNLPIAESIKESNAHVLRAFVHNKVQNLLSQMSIKMLSCATAPMKQE